MSFGLFSKSQKPFECLRAALAGEHPCLFSSWVSNFMLIQSIICVPSPVLTNQNNRFTISNNYDSQNPIRNASFLACIPGAITSSQIQFRKENRKVTVLIFAAVLFIQLNTIIINIKCKCFRVFFFVDLKVETRQLLIFWCWCKNAFPETVLGFC